MKKLWRRWRQSSSPADLPPEFQIGELPDGDLDSIRVAEFWKQVQTACADLIQETHRLREEGQLLQAQAQAAGRLMSQVEQLRDELALAQRTLADQSEKSQREREALLVRFAIEVFEFQKTMHDLEERGLDRQLGKGYNSVRILKRRMDRLLREEKVSILDPVGREPDPTEVDVMTFVTRPEAEREVIVETVEPVVVQAGRVIGRGKVVVAIPPE